jgi:hypothetical protein
VAPSIAENKPVKEHRLVELCAQKLKISNQLARNVKYIRKTEDCIAASGGQQWWEEDIYERNRVLNTCLDLQKETDSNHARAYEQGKNDALWLNESLNQNFFKGYRFDTRQSLFTAALLSRAWNNGVLSIDSYYHCLLIQQEYTKRAWSSQHSGFTDHLKPAQKKLFFSLPER